MNQGLAVETQSCRQFQGCESRQGNSSRGFSASNTQHLSTGTGHVMDQQPGLSERQRGHSGIGSLIEFQLVKDW